MLYHLKLEVQKTQSFIFRVPKLKYMLGANSALGEYFAKDLPDLIKNNGKRIECIDSEKKLTHSYDDIYSNFEKGIIGSAGGHFEAIFDDRKNCEDFLKDALKKAEDFLEKALKKAKEKIPGIKISCYIKEFDETKNLKDFNEIQSQSLNKEIKDNLSILSYDSPYFMQCSEDGKEPGIIDIPEIIFVENRINDNDFNFIKKYYRDKKDKKYQLKDDDINPAEKLELFEILNKLNIKSKSITVNDIEEQGDKFYSLKTNDYLCRFYKDILKIDEKKIPYNFDELRKSSLIEKNNKIAIIAIDGNGMGNRFKKIREELDDKNIMKSFVEIEEFWFKARESFRRGLKCAIDKIPNKEKYESNDENNKKLPYIVLMLGGDDLLLVTVPEIALDFVVNFENGLKEYNKDLTISAGIAFVKYNYPFSHGRELAESLLSSAKVKSKLNDGKSAIDWHILFSSFNEDINEIRKDEYILNYDKHYDILTKRPYLLKDIPSNIEKIKEYNKKIEDREKDKSDTSGRNKFKSFRNYLKEGADMTKHYGKLIFENDKFEELYEFDEIDQNSAYIRINSSLDLIELMDFYKTNKKDNKNETDNN
ncbi:MAG TPA: hypothetical protein PLG34_06155 [Spirochaetota bacterium]|jgi:hypothetical protein|nr:MAG: hypothetical protein BWX91_01883 [Spirochaetes bacterium ADurb.Bin133]HNZ26290.1 hypothetical protein [Spirochaetota bacterium]HPY87545.1 hypothetical protein [Spirochaetota bacterium]